MVINFLGHLQVVRCLGSLLSLSTALLGGRSGVLRWRVACLGLFAILCRSVGRAGAAPIVIGAPVSTASRRLVGTTGSLLILFIFSLSNNRGGSWARRAPTEPRAVSRIPMDWSLKLCSVWDSILYLPNLTSIAGRPPAAAVVATAVPAPVRSVAAPFHGHSIRAGHVGCFCPLLSFDHIKLYSFSISYTAQVFPWVILLDGGLMDKYIFFGVISIYKSISISDVEPFDSAKDFGGSYPHFRGSFFSCCTKSFPTIQEEDNV